MKQIARVIIDNFQSHEHTELAFGPGLNVLQGPSDNGKSAVLRAIRWVLYNEPRGTEFVRHGARECRVAVTMTDGAEIVREVHVTKSGAAAVNRYTVTLPGEEKQVFEGFGVGVPDLVAKAHGMPRVLLDADKRVMLNFGTQLEGPFLMSETGSFRAKAIGRLLGIHVVDAAVRGANADLKAARQEVGRQDKEVSRLETELAQFADIPEHEKALAVGEAILQRVAEQQAKRDRLVDLKAKYEALEAKKDAIRAVLAQLDGIEEAVAYADKVDAGRGKAQTLQELSTEYAVSVMDIAGCKANLTALKGIEEAERHTTAAEQAAPRLKRLTVLWRDWRIAVGEKMDAEAKLFLLAHIDSIADTPERVREAVQRSARLKKLQTDYAPVARDVAALRPKVEALAFVDEASRLFASAERNFKRANILHPLATGYEDTVTKIATGNQMLVSVEREIETKGEQYGRLLQQLGKCPTCRTEVGPDVISDAVAELIGHMH